MRGVLPARRLWFLPCLVSLISGSLALALAWRATAQGGSGKSAAGAAATLSCLPVGQAIVLDPTCPALPNVPPPVVSPGSPPAVASFPQPAYDYFAWNSFMAMSWPAIVPAVKNNFQRGIPDTSRTFGLAKADELTVWETFKEKREIFYFGPVQQQSPAAQPVPNPPDPGPWNRDFNYLGNEAGDPAGAGGIPWCDGEPPAELPRRRLLQNTKTRSSSLDESIEVPSQALESPAQLCGGYTTKACACTQPSDAFSCLTDKPATCCLNAAQAACCNVYGLKVEPVVWKKANPALGSPDRPVFYEVKLNYDYYDYVRQNRYYNDQVKNQDASRAGGPYIKLPFRSNDSLPPNGKIDQLNSPGQVLSYSAKSCLQLYQGINQFPVLHPPYAGDFAPCRVGAMQLKAAWIEVDPNWGDDLSTYHTTRAIVYDPFKLGGICQRVGTFGLVGLHIIQRAHPQLPPGTSTSSTGSPGKAGDAPVFDPVRSAKVVGGAFVFATWEHTSIVTADDKPSPDYVYANQFDGVPSRVKPRPGVQVPQAGFYPQPSQGIAVERYLGDDTVLASTTQVNTEVQALLGCPGSGSVWCNYRLIGVQALPLAAPENVLPRLELAQAPISPVPPPPPNPNCPQGRNDPYGICQPEFLANLVIETNVGLQQFRGQPPAANKLGYQNYQTANAGGIQANTDPLHFARGAANIAFGQYQLNSQFGPGFNPVAVNMGGCMGCHGVAQFQGTSFSFVLEFGQEGAQPDLPPDLGGGPAPLAAHSKP